MKVWRQGEGLDDAIATVDVALQVYRAAAAAAGIKKERSAKETLELVERTAKEMLEWVEMKKVQGAAGER